MSAVPPQVQQPKVITAAAAHALVRVYVAGDGRHHWSRDRAITLCGMVTSKADVTKPGNVECASCQDKADGVTNQS